MIVKINILMFFFVVTYGFTQDIDLDSAIKIALENNRTKKISEISLDIAKSQYQQVESSLYPSFKVQTSAQRRDEDVAYSLKGDIPLPLGLGGGNLPIDVNTTILGRDTITSELRVDYTLYSGGKIESLIKQAKLNTSISQKNIMRETSEVIYDVERFFYAYVLANELYNNTRDSYNRMSIVVKLTNQLYKSESLKVKKTDYLRTQVITELIRSTMQKFFMNRDLAKNALLNIMGLSLDENINITYKNYKLLEEKPLKVFLEDAYNYNPSLQQMKLLVKIKEEQIREAKSEFYPKVALFGSLGNMYNSYEYGLNNRTNKESWTIGLGIRIPLFDGFKDKYKLLEKRLIKNKTLEQLYMIEEAIGLQVKHAYIEASNNLNQIKILKNTKKLAAENTELNIEGYQIDLISTADVIQSQLTQSYANMDYSKSVYNYKMSLVKIKRLIGREYEKISHTKF